MLRVQNGPVGAEFENASEVSKCHSGINLGIPSQSASSGDLPFPAGHAENKTTAIQPLGGLPRTSPFRNPQLVTQMHWHGCAQTGDTQGPMPGTLSTPDPLGLRLHHRSPSPVLHLWSQGGSRMGSPSPDGKQQGCDPVLPPPDPFPSAPLPLSPLPALPSGDIASCGGGGCAASPSYPEQTDPGLGSSSSLETLIPRHQPPETPF